MSGEMFVVVGTGLFTVKFTPFDSPPPGAGLNTEMVKLPETVRSLAGIEAVTWLSEMNVVVRLEPLNLTTEFETKFAPLTVSVKAPSPTVLVLGEMFTIEGTGLLV